MPSVPLKRERLILVLKRQLLDDCAMERVRLRDLDRDSQQASTSGFEPVEKLWRNLWKDCGKSENRKLLIIQALHYLLGLASKTTQDVVVSLDKTPRWG